MQEGQDLKNNVARTNAHSIEEQQKQSALMRATTYTHKTFSIRSFK
jgi:hypothetical protein